jgi:hypothetical protein
MLSSKIRIHAMNQNISELFWQKLCTCEWTDRQTKRISFEYDFATYFYLFLKLKATTL